MGSRILAAIGRMLLSFIFILLGVATIFDWEVAEREFAGSLANLELAYGQSDLLHSLLSSFSTIVPTLLVISITFQIIGGLFVFFGFRVRLGSFLLLLYLIPTTVLYHHFWLLDGHSATRSLLLFLKNSAIIGGLFVILAVGKGLAVPPRPSKKKENEEYSN